MCLGGREEVDGSTDVSDLPVSVDPLNQSGVDALVDRICVRIATLDTVSCKRNGQTLVLTVSHVHWTVLCCREIRRSVNKEGVHRVPEERVGKSHLLKLRVT